MTSEKSTEKPKASAPPAVVEPKLVRVRGVRAKPGGWVWVNELADGWATFPDRGVVGRRLQWVIGILILALIPVDYLAKRLDSMWLQFYASAAIIVLILALALVGNLTDGRVALDRRRARNESMLLAGGKNAFRSAIRTHGRARTVGEMNIFLGSIGRTDPVYSDRRIARCVVDRRWWRTNVELTLTGDHSLGYRAYGLRAPRKLARVFAPEHDS
ncbi:MAG TPA: hypothetical protein VJ914_12735 [Pseudonocardiaceae bacterium]|nr:hypothetical protein [Pseudonocardiaceae bacterium]